MWRGHETDDQFLIKWASQESTEKGYDNRWIEQQVIKLNLSSLGSKKEVDWLTSFSTPDLC